MAQWAWQWQLDFKQKALQVVLAEHSRYDDSPDLTFKFTEDLAVLSLFTAEDRTRSRHMW